MFKGSWGRFFFVDFTCSFAVYNIKTAIVRDDELWMRGVHEIQENLVTSSADDFVVSKKIFKLSCKMFRNFLISNYMHIQVLIASFVLNTNNSYRYHL